MDVQSIEHIRCSGGVRPNFQRRGIRPIQHIDLSHQRVDLLTLDLLLLFEILLQLLDLQSELLHLI